MTQRKRKRSPCGGSFSPSAGSSLPAVLPQIQPVDSSVQTDPMYQSLSSDTQLHANPTPDSQQSMSQVSVPAHRPKRRKNRKLCGVDGPSFIGHISLVHRDEAEKVACNIHTLPVPEQVTHRLIIFCGISVRGHDGTVGIAWRGNDSSSEWTGATVLFPMKKTNDDLVHLFAVASAMRFAIDSIHKSQHAISTEQPVNTTFFRHELARTRSHLHQMKREVFIFTTEHGLLKRLSGISGYRSFDLAADQIQVICGLSNTLAQQEVHVELHLCPAHRGIEGERKARDLSRMREVPKATLSTPLHASLPLLLKKIEKVQQPQSST